MGNFCLLIILAVSLGCGDSGKETKKPLTCPEALQADKEFVRIADLLHASTKPSKDEAKKLAKEATRLCESISTVDDSCTDSSGKLNSFYTKTRCRSYQKEFDDIIKGL